MDLNFQQNIFIDCRDYNIQNKEYNLRIELDKENIYFYLIKLNPSLEYIYTNRMDLQSILQKFDLNPSNHKHSQLKIFDKIYKMNNILIKIKDDKSCNLYFIIIDSLEDNKKIVKIKLSKKIMKNNNKFKKLYNEIIKKESSQIEYNKEIEEMKQKISELYNILNKREEETKYILNKNDTIIKKINEIILRQENKIKENSRDETIKKRINEIENNLNNKINNQIKELNNNILKINNKINDKEIFKNEINNKDKEIFNIKSINKENENKNNEVLNKPENNIKSKFNIDLEIINNKINEANNNTIKELNNINNKFEELKKNIHNKEYTKKINYKFKNEPKNLKYTLDITNTNTNEGWNDIFEIFISYKDNKEYLISPNNNNYKLDIFFLFENKKISSLSGHNEKIRTIRYFINKNNYNEYLISADDSKILIVWDIINNYKIKHQIDTKYEKEIYSCLLIFPHNLNDNFIITSTVDESNDIDKSSTKVYSLSNGQFIKNIKKTNNNSIYYLLSWYNKNNNKYYIIQFSNLKIIITDLQEDELYSELKKVPENAHYSGFIYKKQNKDYLCSPSFNGCINIWDLYEKQLFKTITNNTIHNILLAHIIQWNYKYSIVADIKYKSFKIIDLENYNIISDINSHHTDKLICIKKIYHPLYGESLLSAAKDNTIKLWTI